MVPLATALIHTCDGWSSMSASSLSDTEGRIRPREDVEKEENDKMYSIIQTHRSLSVGHPT